MAPAPLLPDDVLELIFERAAEDAAAVDGVDAAFVCRHARSWHRRYLRAAAASLLARAAVARAARPRDDGVRALVEYCGWRQLHRRDAARFLARYADAHARRRRLAAHALLGGPRVDVYGCHALYHVVREWAGAAGHRGVARALVRYDPMCLREASPALRDDRRLVLAAVRRRGPALAYASARLRDDREVVEAAVRQDGAALAYAHRRLQADARAVGLAVDSNGDALFYAAEHLRCDLAIVRRAVRTRPYVVHLAPPAFYDDPEVAAHTARLRRRGARASAAGGA